MSQGKQMKSSKYLILLIFLWISVAFGEASFWTHTSPKMTNGAGARGSVSYNFIFHGGDNFIFSDSNNFIFRGK